MFAAFDENAVTFTPNEGVSSNVTNGVTRSFCPKCGSSLVGRYDYLPGQVYISMGVIDQANDLTPEIHTHESERLTWLHIDDDLERVGGTGGLKLNEKSS